MILPSTHAVNQQFIGHYGKALADMAAKQAVDATFNHDLVRLHVITQDIVDNPNIKLATIHDVENNLLVQAGDTRLGRVSGEVFTTPIILHDSIAGYVSVTVDIAFFSQKSVTLLVVSTAILLLVLSIWSLFRSNALEWLPGEPRQATKPVDANLESAPTREKSDQSDPSDNIESPSEELVFAVIHVKNLAVLKQQLNGQNYRDTIAKLEQVLTEVVALYGGRGFALQENYYLLDFDATNNRGEALFHAACSAFLTLELAGIIGKIPLDLAALVASSDQDLNPDTLPFAGLIIDQEASEEVLMQQRVEFMDLGTENGRKVISGFRQPFKNLLDNQRKHLC